MKHGHKVRRALSLLLVMVLLWGSILPGSATAVQDVQPPVTETGETEPVTLPQETEPSETTEGSPTEASQTIPAETGIPTGEATVPTESPTIPTEGSTIPTEETTASTEETSAPTEIPEETAPEETETTGPAETAPEETAPPETLPEETEPSDWDLLLEDMEALEEEAAHLQANVEVLDEFTQRLRDTWNRAYDLNEEGLISDEELAVIDEMAWGILDYLKTEYRYENGVITPLGIQRSGSQEMPMAATAQNSVASLGSGSGIKFRIFNYTNGKDANGNYITEGGINDNGLSGYFDFRGTSYENTGADGKAVSNFTNSVTDIDGYTANHATVLSTLGSDGYPVFDGSRDNGPKKSLGYLFGAGGNGVTGYTAANTLLRLNDKGQYYYNSAENAVDFNTATNQFIVRTYRERGQTTANQQQGQYYDFFPFTYWNGSTIVNPDSAHWYNYNNTVEVDYWYGMTMEASFSMPQSGHVNGQENMVFEFSGDDDVWVFIDDVLVLDLGGTHGVVSGSINFATGEVQQYLDWGGANSASTGTSYPTNLEARFLAAGRTPNGGWSASEGTHGKVFADYTEHTIKFYYLERATSCANCKILFNMPILPTGKLTVEKQVEGTLTGETEQAEYRFVLCVTTGGTETAAGGVSFDVIDAASGTVTGTETTAADGTFTLKAGERAEFDLKAGRTFLVRETDPGLYAETVKCTLNGTQQEAPAQTGEITIDPDAPSEVVFTNRLKTTGFAVSKQVAGNMGDRDQLFSFRARLYTGEPGAGGRFVAFPEPEAGEEYTVLEGEARFQLKHGTEMTFDDIPIGAYIVLTEDLAEGYETVYQIGETEGTGRTAQIDNLTAPVQAAYTNTREVLIDTGVSLDTVPYVLMVTGASAGLLLPRGRRRKKE